MTKLIATLGFLFFGVLSAACDSAGQPVSQTPVSSAQIDTSDRIAFVGVSGGTPDIYLIRADGTDEQRLTDNLGFTDIEGLAWSPDGQELAFGGRRVLSSAIYVIHADGTGLRRLTSDRGSTVESLRRHEEAAYARLPSWSPDGKQSLLSTPDSLSESSTRTVPIRTGLVRACT